jgi:hypothetical protein
LPEIVIVVGSTAMSSLSLSNSESDAIALYKGAEPASKPRFCCVLSVQTQQRLHWELLATRSANKTKLNQL